MVLNPNYPVRINVIPGVGSIDFHPYAHFNVESLTVDSKGVI
jgi:hypothetical protein